MKINLSKFGDILLSRPAGHEAFLVAKAYLKPPTEAEPVEIDFSNVKVMTPSWLDEFLTGLKEVYGNRVVCLPSQNASVIESLKAISDES